MAYGRFPTFEKFLDSYLITRKATRDAQQEGLSFGAKRGERRRHNDRDVVEIKARILSADADDVDGDKHQHLKICVIEIIDTDADVDADLQAHIQDQKLPVFVSIRYGDRMGIPERVPGLDAGVEVHMRGEWITKEKAYSHGGEQLSVLHFTHDPLGFVCLGEKCFS